jgi:hypothetical protein
VGHSDLSDEPAPLDPGANESAESRWAPGGYSVARPVAPDHRHDLPSQPDLPSLVELLRRGDHDAIAGFRDSHRQKVRGYCEQACLPERIDEACAAALTEFVARVRTSKDDVAPVDVLLAATRAAAAGRFNVIILGAGVRGDRTCAAMPELLAAQANGELRSDGQQVRQHVEQCETCRASEQRMREAERTFAEAIGW